MHFKTTLVHLFAFQAAAWSIPCDGDDCSDTTLHQRAAAGSSPLSIDAQYELLESQEIVRLQKAGAKLKGPKTCPQGQVLQFQNSNTVVCKRSIANASSSGAATARHSGTKTATGIVTRTRKGSTHKATGKATATRKHATHKGTATRKHATHKATHQATHTRRTKVSHPKPTHKTKARPAKGGREN